MTNKCGRCKGKGYVWVTNGPDDCDKDYCDECDGKGMVPLPDPHEPEAIADILPRVLDNMKKHTGGEDYAFEVLLELTHEQNDAVSNISYLADGVSCSYTYKGKQYVVTVKPERLVK